MAFEYILKVLTKNKYKIKYLKNAKKNETTKYILKTN